MKQNDTTFYIARIGAVTGWLTLAGILAFSVIGPQIVAGQRVSGTLDPACRRLGYASRIHGWLAQSAERLTQTVGPLKSCKAASTANVRQTSRRKEIAYNVFI